MLDEPHVMITGGAGFIGSHLCERLLREGCEVLCVDNFYTGSRHNIHYLLADPRFELMRHDVCLPLYVEVDQIYNLACPASPIHYQFDPVQTTKTSVHGAINMLGLAKRVKAKILQASTSEVYGDPEVHPQCEEYWGNVNPIGPRSCYDEGKRCAETLFFDYHRQHGMRIKVARIFNTYGPRMHPDDGRVVSNFIVQALRGDDLTIYGDGSQTRSFCYVDDLIDGMLKMMDSEKGFYGPVNIGNPGEFTMLELAERVLRLTGSKSHIVHRPLPQDDPKQRKPDMTLARSKLDWRPRVSLDDGLKETVAYFKKLLARCGCSRASARLLTRGLRSGARRGPRRVARRATRRRPASRRARTSPWYGTSRPRRAPRGPSPPHAPDRATAPASPLAARGHPPRARTGPSPPPGSRRPAREFASR
jgi:UDP-glucuronate decarboxylase